MQVASAHGAKQGSQAEGAKCLSTEGGAGWGNGRRGSVEVLGAGLEAREAGRDAAVGLGSRALVRVQEPL